MSCERRRSSSFSLCRPSFPAALHRTQWTPERRYILTGSTSGEFTAWNGLTFNFVTILQAHDTAIRAWTFNHAGTYIASADQTGIIKYFQPNMNDLTAWPAHRGAYVDSFSRRMTSASPHSATTLPFAFGLSQRVERNGSLLTTNGTSSVSSGNQRWACL
jgi:hypothetical protein